MKKLLVILFVMAVCSTTIKAQQTIVYQYDNAGNVISIKILENLIDSVEETTPFSVITTPNPTKGKVQLLIKGGDESSVEYAFYTITSQPLLHGVFSGLHHEVDLGSLERGIYILEVKQSGNVCSQKILKN